MGLLLAMMLAMAAGMLVAGPIVITPRGAAAAGARSGLVQALDVLACLPLTVVGLWGRRAARRSRWPSALATPWIAFFGLCIAMSAVDASYHLGPGAAGLALTHVAMAAAMTTLALALMAERVDALFGRTEAIAGACALAGCAGLWWFRGQWSGGPGDLRALLHGLLAAAAACPAYRIVAVSRGRARRAATSSEPTQRSTSLNTSS